MLLLTRLFNRGATRGRIAELARKAGDLTPLREPVREILVRGNRERALAGTDVQGRRFAPLAPSTLRRRVGTGPPLAPRYQSSRVVTEYEVDIRAGEGQLSFIAGWPGVSWMEHHHTGTPRMPRRDPYGFRQRDLDAVRALLKAHMRRR